MVFKLRILRSLCRLKPALCQATTPSVAAFSSSSTAEAFSSKATRDTCASGAPGAWKVASKWFTNSSHSLRQHTAKYSEEAMQLEAPSR